jgi:uncharacterized protein YceK
MKKILLASLLAISTLSGCGTIVGMRADAAKFDFKTTQENIIAQPLKADSFKNIKSVVIADISSQMGSEYPADNKRLYKSAIKELEVLLRNTGKYKIISAKAFRKKMIEMDVELDLMIIDEKELESELAKLGKSLGAGAVVSFGLETAGDVTSLGSQFSGMGQLLMDGALTIDMIAGVDFISSKNGSLLWQQKSNVQWITGTQGLKTTSNTELRKKLSRSLFPIVNSIVVN